MARLNEPAAPLESLDSIKRRYLRQNRDLAKTNSIQSIRIRALEAEISRLLTENLELREEILQLRNDAEEQQDTYTDGRGTDFGGLKERLEDKLQEIGSLIAELGSIKAEPKSKRRKRALAKPVRCEADILDEAERRLPSILENRSWPGPLTGVSEFKVSPASAADSFELEPPPIAQFRDDDIETHDYTSASKPSLDHTSRALPEQGLPDPEKLPDALANNLETRKKRRESVQAKRVMIFEESSAKLNTTSTSQGAPPRTGAKRKLGSRDYESASGDSKAEPSAKTKSKTLSDEAEKLYHKDMFKPSETRSTSLGKSERKAFTDKPVNTDPVVSPRKAKRALDAEKLSKPTVVSSNPTLDSVRMRIKERKAAREDRKFSKPEPLQEDNFSMPSAIESEMPPKTPGLLPDILSPLSSQPSTGRILSKDTPPPAGLTALAAAEAAGRGSRRARAAVNYAEPNLISKMRRPTKELVDAVGKDGRPVFGAVVVREDGEDGKDEGRERTWRPMSSTSANDLVANDEAPSPLGKKLSEDVDSRSSSSTSEVPMALAMAESRKRRASAIDHEVNRTAGHSQDLSIYEFASSSPNDKDKLEMSSRGLSRRRSTILDGSGDKALGGTKDVEAGRVSRPSARRRSMMV